jgi:hypothetical protein
MVGFRLMSLPEACVVGLFTSGVVYPPFFFFLIPSDILIKGTFLFPDVFLCCYILEFGRFFLQFDTPLFCSGGPFFWWHVPSMAASPCFCFTNTYLPMYCQYSTFPCLSSNLLFCSAF